MTQPLFTDTSSRHEYLGRILLKELGDFPHYGAAMDHAAGTRLGLSGDSGDLKADCALVMAGEVLRRMSEKVSETDPEAYYDEEELEARKTLQALTVQELAERVSRSGNFYQEFAGCRRDPDYQVDVAVAQMSGNTGPATQPEPSLRIPSKILVDGIIIDLISEELENTERTSNWTKNRKSRS